jgi:hypothetical protein
MDFVLVDSSSIEASDISGIELREGEGAIKSIVL